MPETPPPPAAPPSAPTQDSLLPQIFRVAWLSIGLGITLEVLLLMLGAFTGTAGDSAKPAVAELAQKISWSFLVCVGLAFGTAARRLREAAMGSLGLLAAPLAFIAAKATHKGLAQALGLMAPGTPFSVPLLVAGLKALEYGALGTLLGYASRTGRSLAFHATVGLATGLTFGSLLIWTTLRNVAGPVNPIDLAGRGINEVLFPLGCSLVIFAADALGRRVKASQPL